MGAITVNMLITGALKGSGVLGVGQPASAEDVNDAMFQCNLMLAQWNRKRSLIYHLVDVVCTSNGAESYTVGAGGDFNTPRTDKIDSAFFRQLVPWSPTPVDYPLEIYKAREDYNLIALKSMGTWPRLAFFDSGFPMGSLFIWPVPQASLYEIHISVKQALTSLTALNQSIVLPEEYYDALFWGLAQRLRPLYQMGPDAQVDRFAASALRTLRGANVQIPRARLPGDLLRHTDGYNIYSDDQ